MTFKKVDETVQISIIAEIFSFFLDKDKGKRKRDWAILKKRRKESYIHKKTLNLRF